MAMARLNAGVLKVYFPTCTETSPSQASIWNFSPVPISKKILLLSSSGLNIPLTSAVFTIQWIRVVVFPE
jgi:hypothetical protein